LRREKEIVFSEKVCLTATLLVTLCSKFILLNGIKR